ncbi:hypothetical protein AB1N83_002847 [Pleurotus pulmonarius]
MRREMGQDGCLMAAETDVWAMGDRKTAIYGSLVLSSDSNAGISGVFAFVDIVAPSLPRTSSDPHNDTSNGMRARLTAYMVAYPIASGPFTTPSLTLFH